MREYNQQVLRKLQLKELEILKDFDTLCRKHDIPYFIFYGSGIGALRHGGFIPWDDDIDVMLLREDFEKFCCVAKKECSDRYYLLSAEDDTNYPQINTHWGLKGTAFVNKEFKNVPCEFTISIDLFPLDAVSDNEKEKKKQCYTAWFWQKLMILRRIPDPVVQYRGLKRKVFYFLCGAVHIGMKILHISPEWLYRKCKEACLRYSGQQTERVGYFTSSVPGGYSFNKAELFPPRYLNFEGVQYPFPNQLEALLTRVYGDYMQLPPVEKRVNHFPYLLDFGDGEAYTNE